MYIKLHGWLHKECKEYRAICTTTWMAIRGWLHRLWATHVHAWLLLTILKLCLDCRSQCWVSYSSHSPQRSVSSQVQSWLCAFHVQKWKQCENAMIKGTKRKTLTLLHICHTETEHQLYYGHYCTHEYLTVSIHGQIKLFPAHAHMSIPSDKCMCQI